MLAYKHTPDEYPGANPQNARSPESSAWTRLMYSNWSQTHCSLMPRQRHFVNWQQRSQHEAANPVQLHDELQHSNKLVAVQSEVPNNCSIDTCRVESVHPKTSHTLTSQGSLTVVCTRISLQLCWLHARFSVKTGQSLPSRIIVRVLCCSPPPQTALQILLKALHADT